MDSEHEYLIAYDIVHCGQTAEEWDALRREKGTWLEKRVAWKQFRNYSIEKLIEIMESYKYRGIIHYSLLFNIH